MRTQDEILGKLRASKSLTGFEREVWARYLDFEHAKILLPDLKPEKWGGELLDEATVLDEMKNYAEFGWEKIQGHRGLSAGRTVEKMCAWLWLLGTEKSDALIRFAEEEVNYPQYGAPILGRICEEYGFNIPQDEGLACMRRGLSCISGGCSMGCEEEE